MTNKKVRFILNPKAGLGLNDKITGLAVRSFSPKKYDIEILFTRFSGHAVELSRQAADKNYNIVVAVGGDGTINEVAQSLKNSQTALAIVPAGSGNGFARHFKIPMNPEKALEVVRKEKIITVDHLLVNDSFCMNIAGMGFDAHIAHLFASYGKRGFMSYAKLVSNNYFSFHEQQYTIEYGNKKLSRNAFIIAVANASQFGNGVRIAPLATPDDGMIDVIIVKKVPVHHLPFMLGKLFNGKLANSDFVEIIKSTSFHISSDRDMIHHIDGEPRDACKNITASIHPASIRLIVP